MTICWYWHRVRFTVYHRVLTISASSSSYCLKVFHHRVLTISASSSSYCLKLFHHRVLNISASSSSYCLKLCHHRVLTISASFCSWGVGITDDVLLTELGHTGNFKILHSIIFLLRIPWKWNYKWNAQNIILFRKNKNAELAWVGAELAWVKKHFIFQKCFWGVSKKSIKISKIKMRFFNQKMLKNCSNFLNW